MGALMEAGIPNAIFLAAPAGVANPPSLPVVKGDISFAEEEVREEADARPNNKRPFNDGTSQDPEEKSSGKVQEKRAPSKSNAQHSANYRERVIMRGQADDGTNVSSIICSESLRVSQSITGPSRFREADVLSVVRVSEFKSVRNIGTPGKKGTSFYGAIVSYDDKSGAQVMKAVAENRFLKDVTCLVHLNPSYSTQCTKKSGNIDGNTVVCTDSGQYLVGPTLYVAESPRGKIPHNSTLEVAQPKVEERPLPFPSFDGGGIIFDDDPERNALLAHRVLMALSTRKFIVGTLPDVVESLCVPPAQRTLATRLAMDREREYIEKKQVEVGRLEKEVKEAMTRAVKAADEVHASGNLEKIDQGSLIPSGSVEGQHVNKVMQILNDLVQKKLMDFDAAGSHVLFLKEKYNALETLAGEKLTPLKNHWECTQKEYEEQRPWVIVHESIVQDLYSSQHTLLKKADSVQSSRKTCAEDGCASFVVHSSCTHCPKHQEVYQLCTYSGCELEATRSGGLCETHFNKLVDLLKKAIFPSGERK